MRNQRSANLRPAFPCPPLPSEVPTPAWAPLVFFFDWDCDYDDAFIPKGSILPKVHDLTYCALPTPEGDEAAVWETGYGNAIPLK